MPEVTIRTSAAAFVLVLEHEGPTRLGLIADGQDDLDALMNWVMSFPTANALLLAGIADVDARGGLSRSNRWHRDVGDADRPGDDLRSGK